MTMRNSGVQLLGATVIAALVMLFYVRAPVFPVVAGAAIAAYLIYRRKPRQ